jgi:hypothetical protein
MPEFPVFRGNCPRNVSKDAKYSVRSGKTGPLIGLTFCTNDDERWYMTTESHPGLVAMVNAVKTAHGNPPNGSFYINEYKQVIVPVADCDTYYLAGTYDKPLRFEFEGKTLSGEPVDMAGNPLSPGQEWAGPHPGIPYVLAAGGKDAYFISWPRPAVKKQVKLSKAVGADAANEIASMIRSVKGFNGGRFYVNEFQSIFAPVKEGTEWRYLYIGSLALEHWFPVIQSS